MFAIRTAIRNAARSNAAKKVKHLHKKAFSEKYLLYTNMTISLSLSATGDFLEQRYETYCGEQEKWDKRRTMNMGISGLGVGAICHFWYKFLDQHMPGRGIKTVMQKVVLDQIICSPAYLTAFFVTMGVLEGKTAHEVVEEIKQKAWKLYAAEWVVWPIAQYINFCYLPTKYRVLYDNLISLGYDVFISQVKHEP